MSDTPKTKSLWREHVHFANEEEAEEALCDFRDLCQKLERENNQLRAALAEIANASHFDNIGGWARNGARAALAKAQPEILT
jgi:hypothetical protein